MQEFKKGQYVYDTAGYEYFYNQKLENGHLVNKIIEVQSTNYRGDDFRSEYIEGEAIILYEVFDIPPKQKKCDEIIALDTAIKVLRDREQEIKSRILEKGRELANVQKDLENKIKEFPYHNKILKILNNDFSLYYFNGDGVGEYTYGKIVLDIETGEVNSLYKEDSYYSDRWSIGTKDAYETLEIAEKEFLNKVRNPNEKYLSNGLKYYKNAKELFEKYNEEVPEYIILGIEKFKEKEVEGKKETLESARKCASNYAEQVKKLEEELGYKTQIKEGLGE